MYHIVYPPETPVPRSCTASDQKCSRGTFCSKTRPCYARTTYHQLCKLRYQHSIVVQDNLFKVKVLTNQHEIHTTPGCHPYMTFLQMMGRSVAGKQTSSDGALSIGQHMLIIHFTTEMSLYTENNDVQYYAAGFSDKGTRIADRIYPRKEKRPAS